MKKSVVKAALETIRARDPEGILRPDAVVRAARRDTHPLHALFEWDDTRAAEQHRLMQARLIIRSVRVTNPQDAFRPPTPAYVALKSDMPRGGYRSTDDIVGNEELSAALKETALAEIRGWLKRYRALTELTGAVAEALDLAEELVG